MTENQSGPWSDDKFNREVLAKDLLAYIDTVCDSSGVFGEEKSLVVGVDASYGIGKTFFLRAIQEEQSGLRAVAYIDAWADDIVDDPLVSVAATIRKAISPWVDDKAINAKWNDAAKKAGKIALIASKGMAKQALKLAVSEGAVTGIETVLENSDKVDIDTLKKASADTVESISESLDELEAVQRDRYLDKRINNLEEVKAAISALQLSLDALAVALEEKGLNSPIIVIVDELDRCRPDYAIRTLEEIKHIFSSPKVCFLLGMNSTQLAHSISAEYGNRFDGAAYLDRFVDRYFHLPFPSMETFASEFWAEIKASTAQNLVFLDMARSVKEAPNLLPAQWIAALISHYEIAPRQAFKFFDRLRTSIALSGGADILMPYLAELIAVKVSGLPPKPVRPWALYIPGRFSSGEWVSGDKFFDLCASILGQENPQRKRSLQRDAPINSLLSDFVHGGKGVGPEEYNELLNRVGHFSTTAIA